MAIIVRKSEYRLIEVMRSILTATIIFLITGYYSESCTSHKLGKWAKNPDTIKFQLISDVDNYVLQIITDKNDKKIVIPRLWLVQAEDDEIGYVSSIIYDDSVTSFLIAGNLYGIHLSSYDIQKGGSAQAALGRDVFLVYDLTNNIAYPGIINLDVTKERIRSMGQFYSKNTRILISDINSDGLTDLGFVKEEFNCSSHGRLYKVHPIQWYIFNKNSWIYQKAFDNRFPSYSYKVLPLIGLVKSPVDFVKEICLHNKILIMEYADFGVQAMAYKLIGYQWYQWNSQGNRNTRYNIRIVVYKDLTIEEVQNLYPISEMLKLDYRYVEYNDAIKYLDKQIKEVRKIQKTDLTGENLDLYDDLISTLGTTRDTIINALNKAN